MEVREFIADWFAGTGDPLIIAGPCSAESEAQVVATAKDLAATGRVHLFRSGIWKPRSRPGSFSGAGTRALQWLAKVKSETGLGIVTEVASPLHVEAVVKDNITDMVWLGARTVSNPFSVEDIAAALSGTAIPVLVKNPLSPDIDLWTGAIERIQAAGVKMVAAVHRGFSPFERTVYRNMPKWEIPIELRRRFPDIPVICDPSHIAGDAALVPEVAQKAFDLNMRGLMVEVHINPSAALSDAGQQLTPAGFAAMMEKLIVRKPTTDDPGFLNQLEELRHQIDSIDYQIVELIAARMGVSVRMGEYKCRNNVTVLQMERWLEILRTRMAHGKANGLEPSFVEMLMKLL
ncbi:MAG: 3-deoxy-7-phosphoheptulonate synthase, partial [Bacteroidetes bacterium]|nr:3-deoxy-7-phosphoheptulonate synthase [Bacteroidota bacterium]